CRELAQRCCRSFDIEPNVVGIPLRSGSRSGRAGPGYEHRTAAMAEKPTPLQLPHRHDRQDTAAGSRTRLDHRADAVDSPLRSRQACLHSIHPPPRSRAVPGSVPLCTGRLTSTRRKTMKERTRKWRAQLAAMMVALAMIIPGSGAVADGRSTDALDSDQGHADSVSAQMQAGTGAIFNDPNGSEADQYRIR